MEKDLSNQAELLIQNVLCNKLSEPDRNLLQSWLTSRLTIERCGWKRKVQDALQMLEVERKASIEAISLAGKLYDEMMKVLPLEITKPKNKLFFTTGIKNDPLEERVENLKVFKMKEVERVWRWLLKEFIKDRNTSRDEDNNNVEENIKDLKKDTTIIGNTLIKEVPNKTKSLQKDERGRCDELENIRGENLQLKCYLENLSKSYQDILCKYSCLKGSCQQKSPTPPLTQPSADTHTDTQEHSEQATSHEETNEDRRQRLRRRRFGNSVELSHPLPFRPLSSRSLDIHHSGPFINNNQLDLNDNTTTPKLPSTTNSLTSKESLCNDDSEGNYDANSMYDVNSTYDLNSTFGENSTNDTCGALKQCSSSVSNELVDLDRFTMTEKRTQQFKPTQQVTQKPQLNQYQLTQQQNIHIQLHQTQNTQQQSQLLQQTQTCQLQLPSNTESNRSAVRRNERSPSVTITKSKSKIDSNKIEKNKLKKKSKNEKKKV